MWRRAIFVLIALLATLTACNRDPEAAKRQLLASGNKYFEAGKFKEASILYRKTIQKDRRFGEAYYRLGLAELQLGRVAEAVGALERATELQPTNEDAFGKLADLYLAIYFANPGSASVTLDKAQQLTQRAQKHLPESFHLHRVKGFVALTRKDYKPAIESFREAVRLKPEDGPVTLGLAESLTAGGRFDEAEKLAKGFIRKQKSFSGMYDFLYIRYFKADRIDEAGQILELKCRNNPAQSLWLLQVAMHHHLTGNRQKRTEVIEELVQSSTGPDTLVRVGDFYMRTGEFQNALATYEQGMKTAPDRKIEFQKKMVEALAFQGKTPEAFLLVEQVLAENPKDNQALAMRGALRLRSGNRKELESAVSDLETALAAMPENSVLRSNLGEAYLASGNRDRAIVEFQESLKKSPKYLQPRYGLMKVYMANRDFGKVVAVAEEILSTQPDDLNAKMARANAWLVLGKRDLARTGFEEILLKAPDTLEVVYRLAAIHLAEKNYDEAEGGFRKLAERWPTDPRGTLGLAELEIARGRPNNAVRLIDQRINENPNDPTWRKIMGNIAARAGNQERAVRELNLVLAKTPDDASVHQQLAHVFVQQRLYDKAAEHLRLAIKQKPNDPGSNLSLAMVLENQGEHLKSMRYYEKTLEVAPENPIALNNLAFLLAETTDDLDRALSLAQRARRSAPNEPDIVDTLAWIHVKKKLNESAIALLNELLSKHPEKPSWRYHLAMAYYQKGDRNKARKELEAALRRKPSREEEGLIRELLGKMKG